MDWADPAQPWMGEQSLPGCRCVCVGGWLSSEGMECLQQKESVFSEFWAGTKALMFNIEIEVLQEICKEPKSQVQPCQSAVQPEHSRGRGGAQLRGGRKSSSGCSAVFPLEHLLLVLEVGVSIIKTILKQCFVTCLFHFVVVLSLRCVRFFVRFIVTPWTAARPASLSITNSQSLLQLMSIELVMSSNHLIFSSFNPFSSCLQSFAASGSFPMSQLFASGGRSIGASASASVLPVNIQG